MFCTSFALSQPLWEHRALQYNQYSIGKDFFNINQPLQVSDEGELLFSPEENLLYALHNTEVEEYFKGEDVGVFLKKYKLQDRYFFGFSRSIYVGNDYNQLAVQKVGYVGAHYSHFILIDKTIYFTATSPSETAFKLMSYDGHYFQEIEERSTFIYAIPINSVPYCCVLGEKTTDIRSLVPGGDAQIFPWAFTPIYMHSIGDFYFIKPENDGLFHYARTLTTKVLPANRNENKNFGRYYLYNDGNELILYDLEKYLEPISVTTAIKSAYYKAYSEDSQSLYLGSNNQLTRLFTYLKTYPRLYNDTNSDRLFALALTPSGKLWAGSYNGGFSVIDQNKLIKSPLKRIQMNYGALPIGEKVLFNNAHKGLFLFESPTSYTKVNDTIVSHFNFLSAEEILYTDVEDYGLAYKPLAQLEQRKVPWKSIGKQQGLILNHCQGIAQDNKGYIWTISMQGIARYAPKADCAQTLLYDKEQSPIRGYTLLADSNGTLWFGNETGQLYYHYPTDREQVDIVDFHLLEHPLLLGNDRPIVFLHQWRDYLIVGVTNKLFVVSLSEFAKGKANVRYLNPYAMNLQDPLERACVASNPKDDHIWFASSNMLFRWDIAQWLSLANFKAEPTLTIDTGKNTYKSHIDNPVSLEVNENSFEIRLHYQTKDNLPRYVIPSLYMDKQEDAIEQGSLTTDTEYRYQNLSAGNYVFSLTVCQNDGTYTVLQYPIIVKRPIWQNSYFWLVMILIPAFTGLYLLYNMRRMDRQDREIALLTIGNLGKQFRPH
ncbi:sensor histidine kinase, partial [uncultured Capnocytophaga sp.]|uniref:sensor histidine kinase n=1 Tax=uncultured Capnocytophaga sp. TaxID=159273 RepID=UPI0026329DA2